MSPKLKEMEKRFYIVTDKLKALGFKGDVMVSGGLVMFGCKDKYQASFIRAAVKHYKGAEGHTLIENRFSEGRAVFTIVINECFTMSRKTLKRQACNFLAVAA